MQCDRDLFGALRHVSGNFYGNCSAGFSLGASRRYSHQLSSPMLAVAPSCHTRPVLGISRTGT